MDKLKLEPTAACVMKWAKKLYNDKIILDFISQLDLSSGENLFSKCDSIWREEVILNRKYFIRQLIEKQLAFTEKELQLIFLAAGKSPLALELLIKNYSITSIFEIDISGMVEKKELYNKVLKNPMLSNKLKCITADITSSNLAKQLDELNVGYKNDINTIILLEGISYYISKSELKNIFSSFKSKDKENIIIIEYLVPCKCVDEDRQDIAKVIFKAIQESAGLDKITCYTEEELKKLFKEEEGYLTESYSSKDMEFVRIGSNVYFKKSSDGWINCAIGRI